MDSLLRKLRGMLGVGLTWSIGWVIVMLIIGSIIGVVDPDSIDPGEEPWRMAGIIGAAGFFSGAVFAAILSSAERRRSIRDLSLPRAALWGALGGAALPLLTTVNDAVLTTTAPLGAIFAVSTIAIARRAALREPEEAELLPPPGRATSLKA